MKTNFFSLAFILAVFLEPRMALADPSVVFSGVGSPGFLTIEGKGAVPTGSLQIKSGKASGTFEVDLTKFDTGIDLRNEHMKEKYLETGKFPKAKLVLEPVTLPKEGYFNWKGQLTLHGVTKKVEGVSFIEGKKIESKFEVNTDDFKIPKATYLGVGLNEKISIVVVTDLPI